MSIIQNLVESDALNAKKKIFLFSSSSKKELFFNKDHYPYKRQLDVTGVQVSSKLKDLIVTFGDMG